MKLIIKNLIVFFVTLTLFYNCTKKQTINNNDTKKFLQNDKKIVVKKNEMFIIELTANMTTGYKWMLAKPLDNNFIELIENDYVQKENSKGLVGVGGKSVWKFKALNKGKVNINLIYCQPWMRNKNTVDKKLKKYRVIIK